MTSLTKAAPQKHSQTGWYQEFIRRRRPDYLFSWQVYSEILEENLKCRKSWLDLGCGNNVIIEENRIEGFKVGLDSSVRHDLKSKDFCAGEVYHLPFRQGSFDLISCRYLLEHLAEPARIFEEVSRILKPEGTFLLQTTNRKNLWIKLSALVPFELKRYLFARFHLAEITGVEKTYYRMNFPELFPKFVCGMKLEKLYLMEDLLRFGKLIFWGSYLHLQILDGLGLGGFKSNIISVYRKLR